MIVLIHHPHVNNFNLIYTYVIYFQYYICYVTPYTTLLYFLLKLTFWMGRIVFGFMSQPRTLMQDDVIMICEKDCKFGMCTSAKATLEYTFHTQTSKP